MSFLADDLLEGRLPGTRGYDIAARYVASQFDALGLQPAGDYGWFQRLTLVQIDPPAGELELFREGRREDLTQNRDFILAPYASSSEASVEAPALFAGYCVSAPNLHYDDFAEIDARGAILVCLEGAPARFPAAIRAHYSGLAKSEEASRRGAKGLILLHAGDAEKNFPFEDYVRYAQMPDYRWLDAHGRSADLFPTCLQTHS